MIQDPPPIAPPAGVDPDAWDAAVDAARRYCNWHVAPVASEAVRVTATKGELVPPTLRLVSVTSLALAGVSIPLGDVEVYGNRITRPARFGGCVTVTMTHGYATLPASITAAIRALVAAQAAAAEAPGVASLGSGPHTMGRSRAAQSGYAGIPDEIARTLDAFWVPACP